MYSIIDARKEFDRLDRMYGQDTSRVVIRFTSLKTRTELVHYQQQPSQSYMPVSVSIASSLLSANANMFYGVVHRAYAFVSSCLKDGAKHDEKDPEWQSAWRNCRSLVGPYDPSRRRTQITQDLRPVEQANGLKDIAVYDLLIRGIAPNPVFNSGSKSDDLMGVAWQMQDRNGNVLMHETVRGETKQVDRIYFALIESALRSGAVAEHSNIFLHLELTAARSLLFEGQTKLTAEEETAFASLSALLRDKGLCLFAEWYSSAIPLWYITVPAFISTLPEELAEAPGSGVKGDELNPGVGDSIRLINDNPLSYEALGDLKTNGKDSISTWHKAALMEYIKDSLGEHCLTLLTETIAVWRFDDKSSLSVLRWVVRGLSPAAAISRVMFFEAVSPWTSSPRYTHGRCPFRLL